VGPRRGPWGKSPAGSDLESAAKDGRSKRILGGKEKLLGGKTMGKGVAS